MSDLQRNIMLGYIGAWLLLAVLSIMKAKNKRSWKLYSWLLVALVWPASLAFHKVWSLYAAVSLLVSVIAIILIPAILLSPETYDCLEPKKEEEQQQEPSRMGVGSVAFLVIISTFFVLTFTTGFYTYKQDPVHMDCSGDDRYVPTEGDRGLGRYCPSPCDPNNPAVPYDY